MGLYIGIDVGTSACRACAIDERASIVASARTDLPAPARHGECVEQDACVWWQGLTETLDRLCEQLDTTQIKRIAVDGTSATLLLTDRHGRPVTPGLMYNDARAHHAAEQIQRVAPAESAAQGAGSSLAKQLYLQAGQTGNDHLALHQADWLSGMLSGRFEFSDENNALKMGYDPIHRRWPHWLKQLGIRVDQLPTVVTPGSAIGTVSKPLSQRWHLPDTVRIVAGTTDSTAGFIATGARIKGTAVTALGSTLVIKILSDQPVFAAKHGVYSHRLGDRWLVGGASNAGAAVLRSLFSTCDIHRYTRLMKPAQPTGLDYYPLPAAGERFPLQDPQLQPRLAPRPSSDARFFQGILESLARIELRGYRLLAELGAPYPFQVITVGGGARNRGWEQIREHMLGVPVNAAYHEEAAYGAALLARGLSI